MERFKRHKKTRRESLRPPWLERRKRSMAFARFGAYGIVADALLPALICRSGSDRST